MSLSQHIVQKNVELAVLTYRQAKGENLEADIAAIRWVIYELSGMVSRGEK